MLTWPLLRKAINCGDHVTFVSDESKARLAQRALGVCWQSAEQARFNSLWIRGAIVIPDVMIDGVISFASGLESEEIWRCNAARMFPNARFEIVTEPLDRNVAMRLGDTSDVQERRAASSDVVVCHVGSGGDGKSWPLSHWSETVKVLRRDGMRVRVIAGEVEAERFSDSQRNLFHEMQGIYLPTLDELYDVLIDARMVIAADSGPGHLAAQIGTTVLSLFGPTDPARWAPIGHDVHIIAPKVPTEMSWLNPSCVIEDVSRLTAIRSPRSPSCPERR